MWNKNYGSIVGVYEWENLTNRRKKAQKGDTCSTIYKYKEKNNLQIK